MDLEAPPTAITVPHFGSTVGVAERQKPQAHAAGPRHATPEGGTFVNPRTYLAVLTASALALLPALPAGAQASSTVSGTIQAITPATSTTPEEIAVSESSGTALFALTSSTTYSLSAAGFGSAPPAVGVGDLAVGEQVQVTPASTQTAGVTDAASVAMDAQITMGQVSSLSGALGGPTTFTTVANGQTASFVEASDAVVAPSGTSLALGDGAVVYSLTENGASSPATAFAVDLSGAYPTLSGTIAAASGSVLSLSTSSGTLAFNYTSSTPVTVGQAAASDAYLVPGAQASVTYSVSQTGATAASISLPATSVSGTVTSVGQSQGVTDLAVSTASGSVTVAVLSTTSLGGASLSQLVSDAQISATGVEVGTTLTATSVSLSQNQATGTITSVSPGASIVVSASSGSMTFMLSSSTAVSVGTYAATAAYLLPNEQVTVQYQVSSANGATVDTATSIVITPQTLSGTVGPNPTSTSFTVATQGGPVTVTVAPDAAVTGTIAAGAAVSLSGVSLTSSSFEAFTVTVQAAPQPPQPPSTGMVVGKIAAVTAQSLTLTGRDGQTYDLALTSATKVQLGRASTDTSILAPGEWARVAVGPDATVANQTDALVIYLFPRTAIGVIESVTTTSTGTVLTLRGRMVGHIFPVGRGRGRGEDLPGRVVGDRVLTITVPTGTPVSTVGQMGSTTTATFQVGEAIAAEGALADQGLVADQVWVLPASAQPGNGVGHRPDHHGPRGRQGHRPDHHGTRGRGRHGG